MARALVVAGNSFVGKHLCHHLRQRSWEVIATSRHHQSSAAEVCDLTDQSQVRDLLRRLRPDCIFQCAGATASSLPEALFRLHVQGTLHLLVSVAEHIPAAPVLLFGSAAEYGQVEPAALPVSEDYPAAPVSFYGASKLAQTEAARVAAAEWQLRILVVRPFNIIGPGQPEHYLPRGLVRRLRCAIASGGGVAFPVANAQATRDWVDVRDVVEAAVGLMERATPPTASLRVYNIASGLETPVRAVAEWLCERAGPFTVTDAGAGPSRANILRSCGDASRLKTATGWQPRIPWQQSLSELWHDGSTRDSR